MLWSKEKIKEISERIGMAETQVYKWWWDQTRKRVKRLEGAEKSQQSVHDLESQFCNLPSVDEFGGYSSRLRNGFESDTDAHPNVL